MKAFEMFLSPLDVLAFDERCAGHAAEIRAKLESLGTPIGPNDTLIAATALRYNAILVTQNLREFGRVAGLQLQD